MTPQVTGEREPDVPELGVAAGGELYWPSWDAGQLSPLYLEPDSPILAESPTQFFPEGSAIRLTFIRGSTGSASGLVLHLGGRDVEAKRRVP